MILVNQQSADFPDLHLPDGRRANSLRYPALWKVLKRLEVPGIDASMGKHALLKKYREHVDPEGAAASQPSKPAKPYNVDKFMDRVQHKDNLGREPKQGQRPIATTRT